MDIPASVSGAAVGAPVFYTCEASAPSQRALVNGAFLSLAIFAVVFSLIGHVEDLPVPLLPGSAPPPYSPQPLPMRRSPAPDPAPIGPAAVMAALDTDHDGVISASEIAHAPAALRKLDTNYDGKLNAQECGADPRLPYAARMAYMRGNPLLAALDADHNGEISASEIQRAPEALATLDKNHDGQLTKDELNETVQTPPRDNRARLALSDKRNHSRRQA